MLLKYWNVPEPAFCEVMTGRDGAVRDFSVPPGQVQPELIKRQNTIAEALFCPPFLALWRAPGSHSCNQSWIWLCPACAKADRDGLGRGLRSAATHGGEHVESGRQRPHAGRSVRTSPAGH